MNVSRGSVTDRFGNRFDPNVNMDDNAKAVLPPPNPTATKQMKILEPEMIALQRCLKACYIKKKSSYLFNSVLI